MLNLALKIREREKLSAAGYLFVVFIRGRATVIYSVLLSAKMIIYILQSTVYTALASPGSADTQHITNHIFHLSRVSV